MHRREGILDHSLQQDADVRVLARHEGGLLLHLEDVVVDGLEGGPILVEATHVDLIAAHGPIGARVPQRGGVHGLFVGERGPEDGRHLLQLLHAGVLRVFLDVLHPGVAEGALPVVVSGAVRLGHGVHATLVVAGLDVRNRRTCSEANLVEPLDFVGRHRRVQAHPLLVSLGLQVATIVVTLEGGEADAARVAPELVLRLVVDARLVVRHRLSATTVDLLKGLLPHVGDIRLDGGGGVGRWRACLWVGCWLCFWLCLRQCLWLCLWLCYDAMVLFPFSPCCRPPGGRSIRSRPRGARAPLPGTPGTATTTPCLRPRRRARRGRREEARRHGPRRRRW
mmetsp:Transcript_5551/g.15507  ORF Transcript_5551/g.15507 Transcript_5551/m.15507 type:complete len:337 (-) Transcript_5551:12-1022(-)